MFFSALSLKLGSSRTHLYLSAAQWEKERQGCLRKKLISGLTNQKISSRFIRAHHLITARCLSDHVFTSSPGVSSPFVHPRNGAYFQHSLDVFTSGKKSQALFLFIKWNKNLIFEEGCVTFPLTSSFLAAIHWEPEGSQTTKCSNSSSSWCHVRRLVNCVQVQKTLVDFQCDW